MAFTASGNPEFFLEVSLTPAIVPSYNDGVFVGFSAQTFTIKGIRVNNMYHVDAVNLEAGITIGAAVPTAKDTLKITFLNGTAADVTPAAQLFRIYGF